MAFPSPTPRRVSRPRWLDLRLVLGIALVLVAVLVGAKVVSGAAHTDKELAVTHDMAAGTTVRADDLQLVDVQLPDSARVYLRDSTDAVGKVLSRPVSKGELLPAAVLAAAPARTTVSVPFAGDAAPRLTRGQRIVVWLSTPTCPSVVLLADSTVQDVRSDDSGNFSTGGAGQDVVLSMTPPLAQRVVTALSLKDAAIRAGVLSGPDPADTTMLPDVSSCATP